MEMLLDNVIDLILALYFSFEFLNPNKSRDYTLPLLQLSLSVYLQSSYMQ